MTPEQSREASERERKATEEAEHHRKKWWDYEQEHILPCFRWADEIGYDLKAAVSANPGHNCTELLVSELRRRAAPAQAAEAGELPRSIVACIVDLQCVAIESARAGAGEAERKRVDASRDALYAAIAAALKGRGAEANNGWRERAMFAIVFDDYDRRHEILQSERAARERFRQISAGWNAHLFVKIASNSRDDRHYEHNAPYLPAAPPAAALSDEQIRHIWKRYVSSSEPYRDEGLEFARAILAAAHPTSTGASEAGA